MNKTAPSAPEISRQLARQALAVCRHYLPAGKREGRYWQVGNVRGDAGRSLYVRLCDCERGKAGNWVDAATGEHGDLLDLIRSHLGFSSLREAMDEAQRFLGGPQHAVSPNDSRFRPCPEDRPNIGLARQLFDASRPLPGSLAARYLLSRGISRLKGLCSIRYHPRCPYRAGRLHGPARLTHHPAMICAVTSKDGLITGIHRTWLDACGTGKAMVAAPRKSLGAVAGNGIRVGTCCDVLAAGEGLETMLSLREALPAIPIVAATSASHLGALEFPAGTRRLYVAREHDAAGDAAWARLTQRAKSGSILLVPLQPKRKDFNEDLIAEGRERLADHLLHQLHPDDRHRFGEP